MSRTSNLKVVPKDETEVEEVREPEFKDGDGDSFVDGSIVQLLTGGPAMTVIGQADDTGRIIVAWFNDAEFNTVDLPAASLEACELEEE